MTKKITAGIAVAFACLSLGACSPLAPVKAAAKITNLAVKTATAPLRY